MENRPFVDGIHQPKAAEHESPPSDFSATYDLLKTSATQQFFLTGSALRSSFWSRISCWPVFNASISASGRDPDLLITFFWVKYKGGKLYVFECSFVDCILQWVNGVRDGKKLCSFEKGRSGREEKDY